jgi:hypothetical protein
LVLVQAALAFAGLEVGLDRPAGAGDLDQGVQPDSAGALAAVERQFTGLVVVYRML